MLYVAESGRFPLSIFLCFTLFLTHTTFFSLTCLFFLSWSQIGSFDDRFAIYRNAIEEELEVLYDAYYEELEQYANYQQRYVSSGGTIPPPPGPGPFPGSVELDKNGAVVSPAPANPKQRERVKQPPQPVVVNGRKQHTHPQPHHHPPPPPEDEQEEDEYDVEEYEEEDEEEEEEVEEEDEDEEEEDDDDDELQRQQQQQQVGRRIANGRSPKGQPIPTQKRTPNTPQPPTTERRNKGRDGLFNIGSSLTVTGSSLLLFISPFFGYPAVPK